MIPPINRDFRPANIGDGKRAAVTVIQTVMGGWLEAAIGRYRHMVGCA